MKKTLLTFTLLLSIGNLTVAMEKEIEIGNKAEVCANNNIGWLKISVMVPTPYKHFPDCDKSCGHPETSNVRHVIDFCYKGKYKEKFKYFIGTQKTVHRKKNNIETYGTNYRPEKDKTYAKLLFLAEEKAKELRKIEAEANK